MANYIEDNATPTPLVFRLVLVLIKLLLQMLVKISTPNSTQFCIIIMLITQPLKVLKMFQTNTVGTYYIKIRISDCKTNLKNEVKKQNYINNN